MDKTSKIKKFFNGRKWNLVRTRKKILIFTILFALVYTVVDLIMTALQCTPDSVLTSEVFSYCKWLVATGTTITLTDKILPRNNVDDETEE